MSAITLFKENGQYTIRQYLPTRTFLSLAQKNKNNDVAQSRELKKNGKMAN